MSKIWGSGYAEWFDIDAKIAMLSVVFSWDLSKAYQRAIWLSSQGYHVVAGGPAVKLNPEYLSDVAKIENSADALFHHSPIATFTTRGCPRQCGFCAVPKLEGDFIELADWKLNPIICDNNLLAASQEHFDGVIDKLIDGNISGIDFNQGLDHRLLTEHHAVQIKRLHDKKLLGKVRLSWDFMYEENSVEQAVNLLRNIGIPKKLISIYVLIGYNDDPQQALHKLYRIRAWGIMPFPMRYQPLNAIKRNEFVGKNWTDSELKRFMRYWSRQRYLRNVPFEEFNR